MELDAQSVGFGGGMTKAVVADGAQSGGQHVAQIAAHELDAWQSFYFGAVLIRTIFPTEGDGVVGEGEHARIVDGGAGDVSAEIFEGGSSGASGLDVHAPFAPDLGVDLPVVFFKQLVEVLSEGALQVRQIDQELVVFNPDIIALGIEPGARNQTVNVRMELQALVPGMEDGGEAADGGAQALSLGEFFASSRRDRGEEQIVGLLWPKGPKKHPRNWAGRVKVTRK